MSDRADTSLSLDRAPVRIQRKRVKGWRMPEGAHYVGRPGLFGNPFPAIHGDRQYAVDVFRLWLAGELRPTEFEDQRRGILEVLPSLRGLNFACWCPLEDALGNRVPCHADVLLEVANA